MSFFGSLNDAIKRVGSAIKDNVGNVAKVAAAGALALTPAGIVHSIVSKVGGVVGSLIGSTQNAATTGTEALGALGGAVVGAQQQTLDTGSAQRQAVGLEASLPSWIKPAAMIGGACGIFYYFTRRAARPRYR